MPAHHLLALTTALLLPTSLPAQTTRPTRPDAFAALAFLEGTWDANVQQNASVQLHGRYSFSRELDGHVLTRHSSSDASCKAPASFDCAHSDLLYVFAEAPNAPLQAIYFDNEGHVIHYDVSTPTPASVVFLSAPAAGPRFRLTYERTGDTMAGRFQMQPPASSDWHTYLEWSGKRD